jgi:hypothetical protein
MTEDTVGAAIDGDRRRGGRVTSRLRTVRAGRRCPGDGRWWGPGLPSPQRGTPGTVR